MKSKILLAGFLLALCLAIVPKTALADGMLIRPLDDGWDFTNEDAQYAWIKHDGRVEKLLLAIDTSSSELENGGVWIFPVPAKPQNVIIDINGSVPIPNGYEVKETAKERLSETGMVLGGMQIYTIPLLGFFQYRRATIRSGDQITSDVSPSFGPSEGYVDVWEHIEKNGVTSEVISARSAGGLYEYLQGKKINIKENSVPVLGEYIGKDYSFVVSWISNTTPIISDEKIRSKLNTLTYNYYKINHTIEIAERFLGLTSTSADYFHRATIIETYLTNHPELWDGLIAEIKKDNEALREIKSIDSYDELNAPAVSINFPSDKVYFPLLPTSVYGGEIVPAKIRIIGKYTPEIIGELSPYAKTEYYQTRYANDDLKIFAGVTKDKIDYTLIDINAPSKMLTEDLWASKGAPPAIQFTYFALSYYWVIGIILLLIYSFLAGIIGGRIAFHRDIKSYKDNLWFGVLGLFNGLSIIGLMAATSFWRTRKIKEQDKELFIELKRRGYSSNNIRTSDSRKLLFVPIVSLVYLLLILATFYTINSLL